MKDVLATVQQRIEGLRGTEREEAEQIVRQAIRQIDLIQQQKVLNQELFSLRSALESERVQNRSLVDRREDEWLSTEEVREVIGHERTYLWELGQAELLKPFEKRGNGNRYRVRDLRRFMEIDPAQVGRTLNAWRSKHKVQTR